MLNSPYRALLDFLAFLSCVVVQARDMPLEFGHKIQYNNDSSWCEVRAIGAKSRLLDVETTGRSSVIESTIIR